jgi:hypothetical protein
MQPVAAAVKPCRFADAALMAPLSPIAAIIRVCVADAAPIAIVCETGTTGSKMSSGSHFRAPALAWHVKVASADQVDTAPVQSVSRFAA